MQNLKPVSYPDYTAGCRVIGQNGTSLVHKSVGDISRRLLLSIDDITAIVPSVLLALVLIFPIESSSANVITDWDVKAVAVAAPAPLGTREMAIIHVAKSAIKRALSTMLMLFAATSWRATWWYIGGPTANQKRAVSVCCAERLVLVLLPYSFISL